MLMGELARRWEKGKLERAVEERGLTQILMVHKIHFEEASEKGGCESKRSKGRFGQSRA